MAKSGLIMRKRLGVPNALPSEIIEAVERLLAEGEPQGNTTVARQRLLNLGYNLYGPDLRSQVTAFQKDAGLEANGRIDPGTWKALIETATA